MEFADEPKEGEGQPRLPEKATSSTAQVLVAKTDPLASTSLLLGVLGLTSVCCCLPLGVPAGVAAIALGLTAVMRMRHDALLRGRELALAGLFCGGITLLLGLIMLAFLVGFIQQDMLNFDSQLWLNDWPATRP